MKIIMENSNDGLPDSIEDIDALIHATYGKIQSCKFSLNSYAKEVNRGNYSAKDAATQKSNELKDAKAKLKKLQEKREQLCKSKDSELK